MQRASFLIVLLVALVALAAPVAAWWEWRGWQGWSEQGAPASVEAADLARTIDGLRSVAPMVGAQKQGAVGGLIQKGAVVAGDDDAHIARQGGQPVLQDADARFYRRFIRSLSRQGDNNSAPHLAGRPAGVHLPGIARLFGTLHSGCQWQPSYLKAPSAGSTGRPP